MARIFVIEGRNHPDPDTNMTADQVRTYYSSFYPELSNAEVKETKENGNTVYKMEKRVGTKGGKGFHLGDILSITTGVLVSPDGIGGVYNILNYMTGESLFTHQLGRAAKKCKPFLDKQFPQLTDANTDGITSENWRERIDALVKQYGKMFDVEPLPKGAYTYVDPITEAEAMVGKDRVIVVEKE